ncbi:ubiquitin-specific protease [Phakopsora pachyrhizi]|nr:ubiquitin-specific protease [Phakopsora pachyrhizi]
MSINSPRHNFQGMSINSLKERASVPEDPGLSINDYINQANYVYRAAVNADNQNLNELAFVEYFKSAGILHAIIKHPGFNAFKSEKPPEYQSYQEIAKKILASTNRANALRKIIEKSQPLASPSPSSSRPRQIGGGISSRIKSLEAAGLPYSNSNPPFSPSSDQGSPTIYQSFVAPQSPSKLSDPVHETHNGFNQPSFVTTALETQSAVRSGSAPPELTNELQPSNTTPIFSEHRSELGITSEKSIENTLINLRSPSEFAKAFPKIDELDLNEPSEIYTNGTSPSIVDLPNVPKTTPFKSPNGLPPPPKPFKITEFESYQSQSIQTPPYQTNLVQDRLINDTSLGAGLTITTDLDPISVLGAPPPYPEKENQSPTTSTASPLSRSHAIRNNSHPRSSNFGNDQEQSHSSLARSKLSSKPPDSASQAAAPSLPEGANEVLPATLMDYFRKSAAADVITKVLFLDLRDREDFESFRIKSNDVVCIEPLVMLKNGGQGVNSQEIEQSLVISPKKEKSLFERRHEFDYVIIYDKRSVQLPIHRPSKELIYSQDPTEKPNKLLLLLYLAIHREEYIKPLKRPPMLLSGGIDGWVKVVGESGIVGRGSSANYQRNGSVTNISSTVNGIPVTFRKPARESDSALEDIYENPEGENNQIKKARRQIALVQRENSPSVNANFIARSVADLTRTGSNSPNNALNPYSQQSNNFQPRPAPPSSFPAINYNNPNGVSSPIALPQQILQRRRSSQQPFDSSVSSQPPDPLPSSYSSKPSIPIPNSFHSIPHVPPPNNYGIHQQPFRPPESNYASYIPQFRPGIQYPQILTNTTPRPLQPPPPALTPGGGVTPLPSYYNKLLPYGTTSPQSTLVPRDLLSVHRETPPITPYSPNRHGPSELYFNTSFEDVTVGLTGLKNLGNTCYMNSTLQCISATVPLARFFKDGSYKRCINRTNPLGTQGQLAESVAELVRVLWGAQYTFVSPITFRDAICKFAPQFRGSDQHDAQEFLGFLLDGLHEDLNLVTQKPAPVEMTVEREAELESLPTQIASAKEWEIYKRRDNSVIVELFQGQYRSRLQCMTCGTTSTTYNTFMYLSLPIPNKRAPTKVTLNQCLDAFLKEEVLDKDDAWNCPKCKKRRKATKRLSIARLPPILLIHLKRFSFKGPFSDKLETFVQYPIYGLDLTSYVPSPLNNNDGNNELKKTNSHNYLQSQEVIKQNDGDAGLDDGLHGTGFGLVYDLYAVVNHFGSLSSGHCKFPSILTVMQFFQVEL